MVGKELVRNWKGNESESESKGTGKAMRTRLRLGTATATAMDKMKLSYWLANLKADQTGSTWSS